MGYKYPWRIHVFAKFVKETSPSGSALGEVPLRLGGTKTLLYAGITGEYDATKV